MQRVHPTVLVGAHRRTGSGGPVALRGVTHTKSISYGWKLIAFHVFPPVLHSFFFPPTVISKQFKVKEMKDIFTLC